MESTRDVAAAAKIGKLLGERLLFNGIPAVSVSMSKRPEVPWQGQGRDRFSKRCWCEVAVGKTDCFMRGYVGASCLPPKLLGGPLVS